MSGTKVVWSLPSKKAGPVKPAVLYGEVMQQQHGCSDAEFEALGQSHETIAFLLETFLLRAILVQRVEADDRQMLLFRVRPPFLLVVVVAIVLGMPFRNS